MISVTTDTMGTQMVNPHADFSDIVMNTSDFQEFTFECGLELKSAILAAIIVAQDEYVKVMQIGRQDQLDAKEEAYLRKKLLTYVADINQNQIDEFRRYTGM